VSPHPWDKCCWFELWTGNKDRANLYIHPFKVHRMPSNSRGEKWWQTVLEIKIWCSQGEGSTLIDNGPICFLLGREMRGCFGVCCSHRAPNLFLSMFPVERYFYFICFAQSYPLLSFIGGPRGRKHCIWQWKLLFRGGTRVSGLCLWWANQNGSLPPKKKKKLGKATPISWIETRIYYHSAIYAHIVFSLH
jgi:hypothetical protein